MNTATTVDASINAPTINHAQPLAPRRLSAKAAKTFLLWTTVWWGLAGVCGAAFYLGALDFRDSTRLSLYGISIWLNAWLIGFFKQDGKPRDRMAVYHDALVIWMLSYAMTNVVWEIPWVIFSPILFVDFTSLDDLLAKVDYMRESVLNMYWWSLASFASVDLRTINRDPTFFTLEIYSFVNLATTAWFFYLNRIGSQHRYLVAVIGCGEPIASTFIFSFTEVFAGFENMVGNVWDILLALVWTQYQYIVFPMIFGIIGYQLLQHDLTKARSTQA